jgi:hypothetical protein
MTRRALFVLAYLALLGAGFWLSGALHEVVARAEAGPVATGLIAAGFLAFILFSAIPFVPGAEIGLGLLMVMGAQGAVAVYAGMITALTLAFAAGRFVPVRWLTAAFGRWGSTGAGRSWRRRPRCRWATGRASSRRTRPRAGCRSSCATATSRWRCCSTCRET